MPKDVYRRHDNCGCTVTFDNGKGKYQNVWSKKSWTPSVEEKERMKNIKANVTKLTQQQAKEKENEIKDKLFSVDKLKNGNDFNVKPGADKRANANLKIVNSEEYAEKFRDIEVSNAVKDKISKLSAEIINRRNGTKTEEIYAIEKTTGRILSSVVGKSDFGADMGENFVKVLTKSKDRSIIILHNHPIDFTFSTNDIATTSKYKSIGTVIASTHAGEVHYAYGNFDNSDILIRDFRIAYSKNKNNGKSDRESRILAWKDSFGKAGIKYGVK